MDNSSCPTRYALWLPKIAFGLVLAGYGVNHFTHMEMFAGMVSSAYPLVPVLGKVGMLLAYVLPALMIVGGALFAVGQLCPISKACILASLSGIMGWAGLAVLVGDASAGGSMMPMIQNAAVLMILYYTIKKMCCCSGGSCNTSCK